MNAAEKVEATIAGFPITGDIALAKCGEHMSIPFKVSNHGRRFDEYAQDNIGRGTWCYYVTIGERMLPKGVFDAEFWLPATITERSAGPQASYGYFNASFAAAPWHYGVTYYEKLGGLDGMERFVTIGCDYGHYWDERQQYDLQEVTEDAIRTVEALRKMYPLKQRCVYSGRWIDEADSVIVNGKFWSKEARAKVEAEAAATGEASS